MKTMTVSAAFTTDKVAPTRDFYVKHLGARVTFDCGWYVNLEFGEGGASLQFMSPREPHHKLSSGDGLIYNFLVEDVEKEHARLAADGVSVIVPLEDHPWGDRGFGIADPNGITLYLYEETEMTAEYRQYVRE